LATAKRLCGAPRCRPCGGRPHRLQARPLDRGRFVAVGWQLQLGRRLLWGQSPPWGQAEVRLPLVERPPETPPAEFARVCCAMYRVEECIKRAKSEAGLAEYQGRTRRGWHHHQALCLIATWFLVQEARRERIQPGAYCSGSLPLRSLAAGEDSRTAHARAIPPFPGADRPPQCTGKSPSLQST